MRASSFQFTHPGKGATRPRLFGRGRHPCFNSRTLGRVRLALVEELLKHRVGFNSRTLGRVRLYDNEGATGLCCFNSRTLGRVRRAILLTELLIAVSIHAPWEGCDCRGHSGASARQGFNSRTLGRVRQANEKNNTDANTFQFTHPGKGATSPAGVVVTDVIKFQFTHPGKGATLQAGSPAFALCVSIHAPWEGCDSTCSRCTSLAMMFQFTHPGKGATSYASLCLSSSLVFQFTHPGKGATNLGRHLV